MKTPMNEPITMFKKQFNFLSMAVHLFPNSDLSTYYHILMLASKLINGVHPNQKLTIHNQKLTKH